MNHKEFYELVKLMRKAQRDYFRTRDLEILKYSKHLESLLDKEIKRVEEVTNHPEFNFLS
jgi:hypothetical protein